QSCPLSLHDALPISSMRLNRWGSNPASSASTSTLSSATGLGGRGRGTPARGRGPLQGGHDGSDGPLLEGVAHPPHQVQAPRSGPDRKSTRLNSSHVA